jgi:hypothetical protein
VFVCPSIWRRFRVLIDAAEPARTVGQFRILMDRRNRAGQIVWPDRQNSQGEETDRLFGLTVITFFYLLLPNLPKLLSTGQGGGGSSTGGGVKGGVFFFFRFFWVLPPFLGGGWSGVATGYLHSLIWSL